MRLGEEPYLIDFNHSWLSHIETPIGELGTKTEHG